VFLLSACLTTKKVFFTEKQFTDLNQLKLTGAIKSEKKNGSKDITPDHLIEMGEGIYPDKNKFELATPKSCSRKQRSEFQIETEYFYCAKDSSIKVILYQWDEIKKERQRILKMI
jgi:hypothetical protein